MGKFDLCECLMELKGADYFKLSGYDNGLEEDNFYFHNQDSNYGMFQNPMKT